MQSFSRSNKHMPIFVGKLSAKLSWTKMVLMILQEWFSLRRDSILDNPGHSHWAVGNLVRHLRLKILLMKLSSLIMATRNTFVEIASNCTNILIGRLNSKPRKNVLLLGLMGQWVRMPDISLIPASTNPGTTLFNSAQDVKSSEWILDLRATDHMTFDAINFSHTSLHPRTSIANSYGVISPVTRVGTITLSLALHLSNTLLVPSLSYKLLSISQVITNLNYVVFIYPIFCLL